MKTIDEIRETTVSTHITYEMAYCRMIDYKSESNDKFEIVEVKNGKHNMYAVTIVGETNE